MFWDKYQEQFTKTVLSGAPSLVLVDKDGKAVKSFTGATECTNAMKEIMKNGREDWWMPSA